MPAEQVENVWAIVELFGHARIAGRLSEHTIGGCSFVRVDIPATDGNPQFTRLFGQGAIYSVTFVTEEIAIAAAATLEVRPVTVYVPALRQLKDRYQEQGFDGEDDEHDGF